MASRLNVGNGRVVFSCLPMGKLGEGKLGDVVELLEKLAQFLIPDRLNGEADAFPGASAHSRALTPPFRPNRCTKQFPHSILDCPSDFCPTLAVDRIARQSNSTNSTTSPIERSDLTISPYRSRMLTSDVAWEIIT